MKPGHPLHSSSLAPSVFIGSSGKALSIAHKIKAALGSAIQAEVWNENVFALGEDTLNNLLRIARLFDFAIIVFNADDITISQKVSMQSPRDNVVFELGLFMGSIGRRRSFTIVTSGKTNKPKMPTDLLGNTCIFLDAKKASRSLRYLKKELAPLQKTILERFTESGLSWLPSTGLAIGYFQNFLLPVCTALESGTAVISSVAKFDSTKDDYTFDVLIPHTLSHASVHGRQKFVKQRKLSAISIESHGRPYPFFVNLRRKKKGIIHLVDYPTTLRASHEAIRMILAADFLVGHSFNESLLQTKEIENFMNALRILLSTPEAAGFSSKVNLRLL